MFLSQFASLVPFKEKPKYDSNGGFRELLLIQATSAFKLNMHLELCCACVQGFFNLFLSAGERMSFYLPLFTRVRVACFSREGDGRWFSNYRPKKSHNYNFTHYKQVNAVLRSYAAS